MSETDESPYAHLPEPVKWEDLRAAQDAGPDAFALGEHDAETHWLLRTVGLG